MSSSDRAGDPAAPVGLEPIAPAGLEPIEPAGLEPIAPAGQVLVQRLWQLYRHDLSEFRGSMPGPDGLYPQGRLPSFFADPDRCGYLIRLGDAVAGFALVRGLSEPARVVGEFFVLRAARRQRVGQRAAVELLRRHPGDWAIPFQEENPGAARFWRRLAAEVAGSGWTEERRQVPGRPELPPDTWLLLTVTS